MFDKVSDTNLFSICLNLNIPLLPPSPFFPLLLPPPASLVHGSHGGIFNTNIGLYIRPSSFQVHGSHGGRTHFGESGVESTVEMTVERSGSQDDWKLDMQTKQSCVLCVLQAKTRVRKTNKSNLFNKDDLMWWDQPWLCVEECAVARPRWQTVRREEKRERERERDVCYSSMLCVVTVCCIVVCALCDVCFAAFLAASFYDGEQC